MQDNVTATECHGWLLQIHSCVKEKADILCTSYNISIHQWHGNILVDVMLNSWLLLIISRWIMMWNKAVFCLEVLIYKRLQI